jgi:hypothetical protein
VLKSLACLLFALAVEGVVTKAVSTRLVFGVNANERKLLSDSTRFS